MKFIIFVTLACFLLACSNSNTNNKPNLNSVSKISGANTKVSQGKFKTGTSVLFVINNKLESGIVQKTEGTETTVSYDLIDMTIPEYLVYDPNELTLHSVSDLKNGDDVVFFQNQVLEAEDTWALGKVYYSKAGNFYKVVCGDFLLDEQGRMLSAKGEKNYQPTTIAFPNQATIDYFKQKNPSCFK